LDHMIGPEIGRSNFLKWTIQFPIQFSDPMFPGIWPQSGVKQKMDHEIGAEIGSSFSINKLGHEIGSEIGS
jgi:hypothetical protein